MTDSKESKLDFDAKYNEPEAKRTGGGSSSESKTQFPSDAKQENETLSRNHPISEFLRLQKEMIAAGMSQEEFTSKYQTFCKENGYDGDAAVAESRRALDGMKIDQTKPTMREEKTSGNLKKIVLKFTTLSETGTDAPSFTIGITGAQFGRDPSNEVSVPTDAKLSEEDHARIQYIDGAFYLVDQGRSFGAGIRIGMGPRNWELVEHSIFSAGTSVFRCIGVDADSNLKVEIIEGPLKGEVKLVGKSGGSIGRSSENAISIPDKELSRRHSQIVYDEKAGGGRYFVQDVGSTNGTYMLLTGPYKGPYKLNLNDHILVGRTGFSINRYDYGISEEIGYRQTMEDACVIVQDLSVLPLCAHTNQYTPQSFFGVFDGHGGPHASKFLSKHLHVNVADGLAAATPDILQLLEYQEKGTGDGSGKGLTESIDRIVTNMLKEVFLNTDKHFLTESEFSENGSTATTVLMLGQRLYCANVGDSRSLLCRNFKPYALSEDHKPAREDEAKRIRDSGGFVINNRVMGELAVSRAFGDCEFKKGIQSIIQEEGIKVATDEGLNWDDPLIIAEPEFKVTTFTESDQFLVLACDGLFDVFTPEDVISFVTTFLETNSCDVQKCAQSLTHEAIRKRNSRDNVSVILILLNKWF